VLLFRPGPVQGFPIYLPKSVVFAGRIAKHV
jgi:hypothetical protein